MKVSIRRAIENDFPQIIDLFQEFALFEKIPEKMINSANKMVSEKEYFNCFIAETDNKEIIGYAAVFFSYHTWSGKSLYMDDLYVKEKYRKNGIGKRLLDVVIEFARKEKCGKVRWQVSNWNKDAQDFYKKMGAKIDDVELNCDLILQYPR
jgi:ribosomal protein S18 acetylase RimI-like enzyme